jgi:putative ABC transport system permease protein
MRHIFGLPVGTLSVVLGIAIGLALGAVAALAVRNRIFFKLGIRNMTRRPGRSAIIVAGLMLGTAIIASALGTGDTMASTVRSSVITSLGQTDEVVSARSADTSSMAGRGQATGTQWLTPAQVAAVETAARRSPLVDGAAPAISESVAIQDRTSRRNKANVTLFAIDPAHTVGFGGIESTSGAPASLTSLGAGETYINHKTADELGARPGDQLVVLAGDHLAALRVRAVVAYEGTGTDGAALLMPLASAQQVLGAGDTVQEVMISNRGDAIGGAAHTAAVKRWLAPTVSSLGLQAHAVKQDGLDLADKQGASFLTMFTTFGMFTISAGILLIFLIFVMLAAERRSEMGTARAVGTQRRHLVAMFLFEGVAYDLVAAAIGAFIGLVVSLAMVRMIAGALSSSDITVRYSLRFQSLVLAYAMGMLLTLVVVTASAWRVSRLNVVSAVRNLPEPPKPHRRRPVGPGTGRCRSRRSDGAEWGPQRPGVELPHRHRHRPYLFGARVPCHRSE